VLSHCRSIVVLIGFCLILGVCISVPDSRPAEHLIWPISFVVNLRGETQSPFFWPILGEGKTKFSPHPWYPFMLYWTWEDCIYTKCQPVRLGGRRQHGRSTACLRWITGLLFELFTAAQLPLSWMWKALFDKLSLIERHQHACTLLWHTWAKIPSSFPNPNLNQSSLSLPTHTLVEANHLTGPIPEPECNLDTRHWIQLLE
jgi:hypothetical protein